MKKNKLIAFGEALIDFLEQPTSDGEVKTFAQYPGGAPANVAVAAAKMGVNSHFVGQVGNDQFGHFLSASLSQYGVNTDAIRFTNEAKTALAFVSLDETGERSFEFYRPPSADVLYRPDYFQSKWFNECQGIFHTCSNTLTDNTITAATMAGIAMAKQADWLISCDINLRTNLWPDHTLDKERILEWLDTAHVIKGSLEELELLTDDTDAFIQNCLTNNALLFVLTDGANPVRYYTSEVKGEVVAPKVDVKDTTAAGDAFVGGMLAQLVELAPTPTSCQQMTAEQWQQVIQFAVAAGAYTVTQYGAYPALPNQEQVTAMQASMLNS